MKILIKLRITKQERTNLLVKNLLKIYVFALFIFLYNFPSSLCAQNDTIFRIEFKGDEVEETL